MSVMIYLTDTTHHAQGDKAHSLRHLVGHVAQSVMLCAWVNSCQGALH